LETTKLRSEVDEDAIIVSRTDSYRVEELRIANEDLEQLVGNLLKRCYELESDVETREEEINEIAAQRNISIKGS